jgi:hypothetical protein
MSWGLPDFRRQQGELMLLRRPLEFHFQMQADPVNLLR